MDLPNGVKPHIFKKDENLYFLTCHPDMIKYDRLHLEPRIPYRRGNGENNGINRVCLGNRLYRILKAVPIIWNDEDYQFYFSVYRAIGYNPEAIVEPNNTLVRDVKATDELWSLEPVDLKTVVDYAKKQYGEIYLAGFSLGGALVLIHSALYNDIDTSGLFAGPLPSEGFCLCDLFFFRTLSNSFPQWKEP